jgi:hypothetical protein
MLNDPNLRRELYVGVIAAIVVMLFVEPLLRLAGSALVWIGANVYDGVSNSIYREAALGLREKFSFLSLAFSISLISGALTGTAIALFRKPFEPSSEPSSEKKIRWKKYLAVAFSVLVILQSLYLVGKNFADLQLNASFNQRIAALTPRVTDQQVKELKARWALMEKRPDYLSIVSDMERIAKETGARLPSPLWD